MMHNGMKNGRSSKLIRQQQQQKQRQHHHEAEGKDGEVKLITQSGETNSDADNNMESETTEDIAAQPSAKKWFK